MPYNLQDIENLAVSSEFAPADRMLRSNDQARAFYEHVGRANLQTIYNILNIRAGYCDGTETVASILDYGCAFGRVSRWMRAAFPDARLCVTDIQAKGPEWCAEHLGCEAIPLALPKGEFDLIWVGSVFTHLPEASAQALMTRLIAALKPNGVLALTSHGRPAVLRMQGFDWDSDQREWMHFRLGRERFEAVLKGYHETGYGYVDYPSRTNYGICIAKGSWYAEQALAREWMIQVLFQERADSRQDVSAFMRASATKASLGKALGSRDPGGDGF